MLRKREALALLVVCSFGFTMPSANAIKVAKASVKAEEKVHVTAPAKSDQRRSASNLFMWKVSSGHESAYLVGSIHMVRPDFYPLPAEMENCFDQSSNLVLEIDESKDDPAATQMYVMKAGLYNDGDVLNNHISKQTSEALEKWITGADPTTARSMQKMKPWFASIMIPVSELQKRGFDTKKGIDKHFLEKAHLQGKKVDELESTEFQLKMLSGFSEDMQNKLLLSSLVDAENVDRDLKDLVAAWKHGDIELMNSVVVREETAHPELKPVMDKLLYERNIGMAEKISEYIHSGNTAFVVVGSGHLGGPKGLIALLRAKNFKVEQVQAN